MNSPDRAGLKQLLSARTSTLWIGFVGLLGLMSFLAIDSGRTLRNVAATSADLRSETRRRDTLLDQLRIDLYSSGTLVRDYALEPDEARAAVQRRELESIRSRQVATMRSYEGEVPHAEHGAVANLRAHVDSYWQSLAPVLQWNSKDRQQLGEEYFYGVILPRRNEIVELAQHITQLNERDINAGETHLQDVQAHFRKRVTIISLVALILGGLLAGALARRVKLLETQAEARFQEVEEARKDLRNLSARLMTAQEEERRRLARELHDEVGQAMSALLVDLGRLETSPPDAAVIRERLVLARLSAQSCVGMVRDMALLLRPSMLDDLGLIPALNWQAREITRRTGLPVKMVADVMEDDLLDSLRTCLYRFVQEALHNCAKHSKATQARVVVRADPGGISVSVQDDGVGFDPRKEKGMGLLGMEERVEQLGGSLLIESEPGQGTLVSMRVPVVSRQPAMGRV